MKFLNHKLIYILLCFYFISPVLQAEIVNINTADAPTLKHNLKGIGEKKSAAIVEYRQKHGNFKAIEEIKKVKGIGEKIFENIKPKITVKDNTPTPQPIVENPIEKKEILFETKPEPTTNLIEPNTKREIIPPATVNTTETKEKNSVNQ